MILYVKQQLTNNSKNVMRNECAHSVFFTIIINNHKKYEAKNGNGDWKL